MQQYRYVFYGMKEREKEREKTDLRSLDLYRFSTVVHAKCITGKNNSCAAVQSEHGVRPMQVRSHYKLQHMPLPKVESVPSLQHNTLIEL
jgi:malate/lactate dehydrogenase